MYKRIVASMITFVLAFGMIYGALSGGMAVFSRRYVAYDAEDIALKRDFGISKEWQEKYGVSVLSEIDLARDDDHDDLLLREEYAYGTDPTKSDTDGDGYNDGREVANGYEPNGDGMVDTNTNDIPDKWEKDMFGVLVVDADDDRDRDELSMREEYAYGTDPTKSDTDGDGYNDGREVANGYDPILAGDARIVVTMMIDRIDVEVPVILAKNDDEDALQRDLEHGVIHYPGTPMPGQRGNVYIAGHSSNYAWSKGDYDYVFKRLNELHAGDVVSVKMTLHNRKEVVYKYKVSINEEVAPDDERIFAQTQSKDLTLTTCWPLGSNVRRLMIKAQLQDV